MLNNVCLSGRLTASPELKSTSSGISVVRFSLAVERDMKSNGEKVTDFFDCIAFRNTAEFLCKYFDKGSGIIVNGSLQMRNYEANDGSKRRVTEVTAKSIYFTGSKKKDGTDENENDFGNLGEPQGFDMADDDLPF